MMDASEFRNVMGNLGERFTVPEGLSPFTSLIHGVWLMILPYTSSRGDDAGA